MRGLCSRLASDRVFTFKVTPFEQLLGLYRTLWGSSIVYFFLKKFTRLANWMMNMNLQDMYQDVMHQAGYGELFSLCSLGAGFVSLSGWGRFFCGLLLWHLLERGEEGEGGGVDGLPVGVPRKWPEDIDIPEEVEDDDDVPRELLCPISHSIMRNPTLVNTSGYTYVVNAVSGVWCVCVYADRGRVVMSAFSFMTLFVCSILRQVRERDDTHAPRHQRWDGPHVKSAVSSARGSHPQPVHTRQVWLLCDS